MQIIKRELLLCLAISAIVFTSALAWGAPFTTFDLAAESTAVNSHAQQTPNDSPSQGQMQKKQTTVTLVGTVEKSGTSYILTAASGKTYKLEGAGKAASYVGKTVTVSGQLNPQTMTIQVSSIQPA